MASLGAPLDSDMRAFYLEGSLQIQDKRSDEWEKAEGRWKTEMAVLVQLLRNDKDIIANQKAIKAKLDKMTRPRRPKPVLLVDVTQSFVGGVKVMKFKLLIPEVDETIEDVVNRTIKLKINDGAEITVETTDIEAHKVADAQFVGPDNATVVGSLVDTDDAVPANVSAPREFSFVLSDTFAPPQPGEVGIEVTE